MKKSALIIMMIALFSGSAFASDACNGNGAKIGRNANTNPAPVASTSSGSGTAIK